MKKTLELVCMALVAAAMVAGCGKTDTKAAAAPAGDGKAFRVGFDADFPPYGYKDGEEYVGFDLDLAREFCNRTGREFVANPINWDAKDMELNSGAIDCIWNGFTIQGREDDYTWTTAYLDNSQVVLVKADSPVQTLADLSNKTVGVQTDTPVQKALSAGGEKEELGLTFKSLVVEPNYNQAVNELNMGALDAVAMDIGVAKKKLADLPGKFRCLDEIVMKETYGVGFKKGNEALRDEVEGVLREMFRDGTAQKVAEKYWIEPEALILE